MESCRDAPIFWTNDESDADLNHMAQRGAYVPGVTDTALVRKKVDQSRSQLSIRNTQTTMNRTGQPRTQTRVKPSGGTQGNNSSKQGERKSPSKEPPSLKDLRPEDKKRVANLVKELAKIGEEKEVALQQLQVEREENELKTGELQSQVVAILKERENIQQQYLECQKLLSSYQSRVSEEHQNLSESLPEKNASIHHQERVSHSGWSPIKESSKLSSPSQHPLSDSHQIFVPLEPVRDETHRDSKRTPTPSTVNQQIHHGSLYKQHENHNLSRSNGGQFDPVLSSTHRPQHRSRVPRHGASDTTSTAVREELTNGYSGNQHRMYELTPTAANLKRDAQERRRGSGHSKGSSGRTSADSFLPLPEMTDFTRSSDGPGEADRVPRVGPGVPQSQTWRSLPEMNGQLPESFELHGKGLYRSHIPPSNQELEAHQDWGDYQSMSPEQRQEQLGSLRGRLQQEQEWLQHKLSEQERLLQEKQLEIQIQKRHLSRLSPHPARNDATSRENAGYERVRRRYIHESRDGRHRREGTDVPIKRSGRIPDRQIYVSADGHQRVVSGGGQGAVDSPWGPHPRTNGVWDDEVRVSTKFPPDDNEQFEQRATHQGTTRRTGYPSQEYRQRQYDDDYYDVDEDEYEDDEEGADEEAWYEMREETEGADIHGSIQGYASLHPAIDRRKQAQKGEAVRGAAKKAVVTEMATSPIDHSYHISDLAPPSAAAPSRAKRGHHSEPHLPPKQLGNISAILQGEELDAMPSNAGSRPYSEPGPQPQQQANSSIPQPGVSGRVAHHGVAGGIPHHGVAGGIPHRGVAGGIPHHGVAGGIPHPGVAASMQTHHGVAGGIPYRGVADKMPDPRRTQGTLPYPQDHNHPFYHYHQQPRPHHPTGVGPQPATLVPVNSSSPRRQRTNPNGVMQSPHPQNRGTNGTVLPPSGYVRLGPDHGAQQEGAQPRKASHLVQRSTQVIRDIGLLLDQASEVGEEEESRVLEDVFFLK